MIGVVHCANKEKDNMKEYTVDFVKYVFYNTKIIEHLTRSHNIHFYEEEPNEQGICEPSHFHVGDSINDNVLRDDLICTICPKYKLIHTSNNPMMERFINHMMKHYKKGEGEL